MKVLVAGAGPGGLTAALCLAQAGIECEVFESVPRFWQLGVGLNLLPHGVRVLTILGMGDRLASAGIATAELGYFNKFGSGDLARAKGDSRRIPLAAILHPPGKSVVSSEGPSLRWQRRRTSDFRMGLSMRAS
jgi:2-polyprenyl-6-methoxyphenol hydroxylase-like FAD-dependent oxidoreductase